MKYTKKKLKNGMRIITIPMKENPTVTVLVLVETGSKYENKDNNDKRAAAVEQYIIQEALQAGVVKEIKIH